MLTILRSYWRFLIGILIPPLIGDLLKRHTRRVSFWVAGSRVRFQLGGGRGWARLGGPKEFAVEVLEFFEPEDEEIDRNANLVIVLVEGRLLHKKPTKLKEQGSGGRSVTACNQGLSSAENDCDLHVSLQILRSDIDNTACDFRWDGSPANYKASVIATKLYAGEHHADGVTVLALRAFLKDARRSYRNLRGVILVGAYPDALIKRTWGNSKTREEEILSYRSDIVLADLDGNWEGRYSGPGEREHFHLKDITGFWVKKGSHHHSVLDTEVSNKDSFGSWDQQLKKRRAFGMSFRHTLAEAVSVVDGEGKTIKKSEIMEQQGRYYHYTWIKKGAKNAKKKGKEYGSLFERFPTEIMKLNEDGGYHLVNPIACPDILVSRINARNVAFDLDAGVFARNPCLERRLLIEYFKRNHLYRIGETRLSASAGIAADGKEGKDWGTADFRAAFRESTAPYKSIDSEQSVSFWERRGCTREDFAEFLEHPATFRSMVVHGSPSALVLMNGKWGLRDWRDRWQRSDKSGKKATFYWTIACDCNTPLVSHKQPYNAYGYGFGQPSECLLFYGDGLAIVSKARKDGIWPGKHPNFDEQPSPPGGVIERTLWAQRTLGEAWRAMFEIARNHPDMAQTANSKNDAIRKTPYVYGITGDWTLRLNAPHRWWHTGPRPVP